MNQTSSQIFESRPHSTGEILALTLQLLVRNFGTVMGIILVVLGPISLLGLLNSGLSIVQLPATLARQSNPDQVVTGTQTLISIVSTCGGLIVLGLSFLQPWMEGALTHNLIERLLGREPSVGDSYRAVRPRFWSLWGSTVLAQIIIAVPFVLVYFAAFIAIFGLIIGIAGADGNSSGSAFAGVLLAVCAPITIAGIVFSILMAINFLFRTPAIVAEGIDGVQALSRSNKLASGNRWRLFGRMAILYVLKGIFVLGPNMTIVSLMLWTVVSANNSGSAPAVSGAMMAGLVVLMLIAVIVQLILTPIGVIYVGLNYLDMRVRNENLVLQIADAPRTNPIQPVAIQPMQTMPNTANYAPPVAINTSAPTTTPTTTTANPYAGFPIAPTSAGQKIGLLFNRLRAEGQSADLLNDLGLAYMDVGDMGGALDAFTRARQLNPDDADIAYNMLLLHISRKDVPAARSTMQDYLRLETNTDDRQRVMSNPKFKELL